MVKMNDKNVTLNPSMIYILLKLENYSFTIPHWLFRIVPMTYLMQILMVRTDAWDTIIRRLL
jgi:hypothetical protein